MAEYPSFVLAKRARDESEWVDVLQTLNYSSREERFLYSSYLLENTITFVQIQVNHDNPKMRQTVACSQLWSLVETLS